MQNEASYANFIYVATAYIKTLNNFKIIYVKYMYSFFVNKTKNQKWSLNVQYPNYKLKDIKN